MATPQHIFGSVIRMLMIVIISISMIIIIRIIIAIKMILIVIRIMIVIRIIIVIKLILMVIRMITNGTEAADCDHHDPHSLQSSPSGSG